MTHDIHALPDDLPAPTDDGRGDHLAGLRVADIVMAATQGEPMSLARVPGRAVVFAYPRTGIPGQPPLVPDWDVVPGARGCTPQTCGFRDLAAEFASRGCRVFGLSTQDTAYQREMSERLHLPFPVLSDAGLELTRAMSLPTLVIGSHTMIARLGWVQDEGVVTKAWYPVFPPDRHAAAVLEWLDGPGRSARA